MRASSRIPAKPLRGWSEKLAAHAAEVKVKIEESELAPGEYGFGFVGDKFTVSDVGANDVLRVSWKADQDSKRPVPLKIVEEGGAYRLYTGRKYVGLKLLAPTTDEKPR